ncbi:MAG: MATE family efflux transporter [Gemmatimonadaceae bacterium]|nr:MATE family efflux transporter [Gemmatimonadaceae bacterium]
MSKPAELIRTIRSALSSEAHHDLTTLPVDRAVVLLAIPMVLEMALESVFALTDIFFVGKLGPAAVATVGLTESLLAIVYAIAMGVGVSVSAIVARRIGEKEPDEAAHTAAQAVWLAIVLAAVLGTTGALYAPQLLRFLGADEEVLRTGTTFARIMLGGEVSVILLFILNAVFRGAGDAAVAMRVLWTANILNIVLGPCFIFGLGPFPALGVTGAAIATTTGRGVGAALALYWLITGRSRIAVRAAHWRPDPALMWKLVRLAGSGVFQFLVGTASWIGLVRILAPYGAVVLAGYTIAIRVLVFILLPSFGLSNAAATMVGQNLGAKAPDRAAEAVASAARWNVYVLGAIGIVMVAFAPLIAGIFTRDAAAAAVATTALRITGLGCPLYGIGMVMTQAFNGAGDTWTPTWLNFGIFWLFEIPFAWLLAHPLGFGPTGVFIGITTAFSVLALTAWALFRRGTWRTAEV